MAGPGELFPTISGVAAHSQQGALLSQKEQTKQTGRTLSPKRRSESAPEQKDAPIVGSSEDERT
jgi:hypothetical protein